MMQLTVNGDPMTLNEGLSVAGLVIELGLHEGPVAVEKNGEVVPRAEHVETRLSEGDVIEIVHFVGGG